MAIQGQGARAVAAKYDVPKCYRSDAELVADPQVDAVYVATSVSVHEEQVIAAAEQGKHVLCEKPLALDLEGCRRMVDACRAAGVKFGGGGALMDLGVHTVDLLRVFLGEVESVTGFAENVVRDYPVDDSSVVLMKFRSGAQGVVESFFNIPDEAAQNTLEVYGTNGCILTKGTIGQGSEGSLTVYSSTEEKGYDAAQTRDAGGMAVRELTPEPVNTYRAEIEAFADVVLNDTEPPISAEDGIRSLAVVLAAYTSSRQGKTVPM